jgi:hypothetical protein
MKIPQHVILKAKEMIKNIKIEMEAWPVEMWCIQFNIHRDEEEEGEYWIVAEGFILNEDDEEEYKDLLYRRIA